MKKNLLIFFLLLCIFGIASAQSVLFWTSETSTGPIRVYWNDKYVGTITKGYSSCPGCYASGCVTVEPTKKTNTWYAVAEDGSRWSSKNQTYHSKSCVAHCLTGHSDQPSTSYYDDQGSSTSSGGDGAGAALAGLGIVVAGLAIVAGEVILNSDLYVSGIASDYYSGLEFGFRNNWNNHISFEQTVAWRYTLDKPLISSLHTNTFDNMNGYDYIIRSNWGCNFRLLYNFMGRGRVFSRNHKFMLNPYVGFGCDYMQYDGFFTSAVAGFTFGNYRVKMDCRYTFGYDFRNQRIPVNQIQLGLIVSYQFYKFGFFN